MNKNMNLKLILGGVVLGGGMGGFFDGILFHQIFQIHNMLSNKLFPDTLEKMQINMFWDGIFHAAAWIMTLLGIWMIWNTNNYNKIPLSNKLFLGPLTLGWGLFNLIEGIINHQFLQLHHIVQTTTPTRQLIWDMSFLLWGVFFIILGINLIKKGLANKVIIKYLI